MRHISKLTGADRQRAMIRGGLPPLHHLAYDSAKGWVIRLTITDNGKSYRPRFRTGTRDPAKARAMRDALMSALERRGFVIRDRRQMHKSA